MDTLDVATKYPRLGALVDGDRTHFRLWAPSAKSIAVHLHGGASHDMRPIGGGYHEVTVSGAGAGTRYTFRLDGEQEFPDPASRFQPEGVHEASVVVDPSTYDWSDGDWTGIPQKDLVFYELHVGTFTPDGTFDGVRSRLEYLKELGITAIELMPLADFPGRWNWGYDHAALYAPSRAYGRPDELRRLVDEAHQIGLAVFLDVIYNHLGPDGAYVAAFAPMFTDKHQTPWGRAINLDDDHSEGVRALFIDNALTWLREYHFDGLRLDATHAIVDDSQTHFLAELMTAVETLKDGPERTLIAEDSRNLNTIVLPRENGGYGLHAVWTDDFHHQIRNMTAGDEDGYFADFAGTSAVDVARTVRRGWFYEGQHSRHSGKPRGTDAAEVDPTQCVVCIQNHDQVGNRPAGDRLNHAISPAAYRAASALVLFVPELPLLFMGQEWAASTPFQFFTDHEESLGRQVSEGRKKEFESFEGFGGDVPDPQDEATFQRSRLRWSEVDDPSHSRTLALYRDLLRLRPKLPAGATAEALGQNVLQVQRGPYRLIAAFGSHDTIAVPRSSTVLLHSEQDQYAAGGHAPKVSADAIEFRGPAAIILNVPVEQLEQDGGPRNEAQ